MASLLVQSAQMAALLHWIDLSTAHLLKHQQVNPNPVNPLAPNRKSDTRVSVVDDLKRLTSVWSIFRLELRRLQNHPRFASIRSMRLRETEGARE